MKRFSICGLYSTMAISAAALLLTGNLACTSGSGQSLNANSVLHIAVDEDPYRRLDATWTSSDLENFKKAFQVSGDTYQEIQANLVKNYSLATGTLWVQRLPDTNSTTYNLASSPASGADMIPDDVYYIYPVGAQDTLFMKRLNGKLGSSKITYVSTKDCQSNVNTNIDNFNVYSFTWIATATFKNDTTTAPVKLEANTALALLKGTEQIPTCFTKITASN